METDLYQTHIVGLGDTIQSIGAMYNVDWVQVVELNGLTYPYVDDSLEDNENQYVASVAKVGSTLLIPTSASVDHRSGMSSDDVYDMAYGCDLDLYSDYLTPHRVSNLEDVGTLTADGGDIRVSRGLDNLRQQLITRLGTPRGALLLHPEFGSNLLSYIGRRVTRELLVDVQLEVQECLLSDFRVDSVSDIRTEFRDGGVRVDCVVYPTPPYSGSFRISQTYTG